MRKPAANNVPSTKIPAVEQTDVVKEMIRSLTNTNPQRGDVPDIERGNLLGTLPPHLCALHVYTEELMKEVNEAEAKLNQARQKQEAVANLFRIALFELFPSAKESGGLSIDSDWKLYSTQSDSPVPDESKIEEFLARARLMLQNGQARIELHLG